MSVHAFTGTSAVITMTPSGGTAITAFVSGDFSLTAQTGKYVTLGSSYATAHTRGLFAVSGTLKRAWGIDDATLMTAFINNTMFELKFDNDGALGVHTYTISNCILTDLSVEGIEAGAEGALMINASFEGLSFVRDA